MVFMFVYLCCYQLPRILLACIQISHIKHKLQLSPILLSANEYTQAGQYAIAKEKVLLCESLFDSVLVIVLVWWGMAEQSWGIWTDAAFVLALLCGISLLKMPFSIYSTFVLDKRFGFFKGSVRLFIIDSLKSFALFVIVGYIILCAFFLLIELPLWWLWVCLFFWCVMLITNMIYPIFIAPFFNKFTPLEEEELKTKINALLSRVGFSASGIFVMDASKRDGRLNAYFGGLGKTKRVVLFDTLLEKITTPQLLAVLGHELGHFKNHDIYKSLLFAMLMIAIIFFTAAHIPASFYTPIHENTTNLLLIIIFCSNIVSFWAMPLMGIISRHNEYAADVFGAKLESPEALADALLVLVKENRSFPFAHPLQIFFYHTHPPLLERLKALGMPISKLSPRE